MKYNKGFAPLIIFLIVLGVGIVGAGAYYVGVNKTDEKQDEVVKVEDGSVVKEEMKENDSKKISCLSTTSPWIKITSPNGNENYTIGQSIDFMWTSCNVKNVTGELSAVNSKNDISLFGESSGGVINNGKQTLILEKGMVPGNYKFKISEFGNLNISDSSDNYFTINESNSKVVIEWNYLSNDELVKLYSTVNTEFIKSSGIKLIKSVDLTGDGIDEGLFSADNGNSSTVFILSKDSSKEKFITKQKEMDGKIYPVSLESVGRAQYNASYTLLPEENGFYTSSLSYDTKTEGFKCNASSVNSYSWNSKIKMFEWNKVLTDKYTKEVCK